MGSFLSSRARRLSKPDHSQRSKSPDPYKKRSSMNRPVLRLQVKPETLQRQGIATSNGVSAEQRSTLRQLAHAGVYDHLLPGAHRTHTPPPILRHNLRLPLLPPSDSSSHTSFHPRRSHSVDALDSMIIVQYVENEDPERGGEEADYDHLASKDDHLVKLSFARRSDVQREEDHFGNVTINKDGSLPHIAPSTSMEVLEVCQRIQDHTQQPAATEVTSQEGGRPPLSHRGVPDGTETQHGSSEYAKGKYSSFKRFHSADQFFTEENRDHRRDIQSVSEDLQDYGMDWSLGESIMRTISQQGLSLFNIDNPTHKSEHEVNRAWPHLREKMRVWRSQQSLDRLESSGTPDDLVFHESHHATPITITAH